MKILTLLCISIALPCVVTEAKTQAAPANFSGSWVLDMNQTKNLPPGLENYSMVVSQDGQQIRIKTILKGDLQSTGVLNGPYPGGGTGAPGSPGSYPGRSRGRMGGLGRIGGMGMPGGGMGGPMSEQIPGMPGGAGGTRSGESRTQRNAAAFRFYPSNAVYKLDGGSTTAQFGGPAHADATLKAGWAKHGKALKLSLNGNQYSGPGGDIELRDQWKFTNDGQSLIVDRAFHSARGSTTLHLIFQRGNTATPATPPRETGNPTN